MKVLFAGLGSIGQRHVRNLRALMDEQVEILAYRANGDSPVLNADMTVKQGATLESTYNIRPFSNLDDALGQKPDAVFVTNPNSLHLSVALAAAEAGCHLFIEKPLADSLDGVEELIEIVERKNLVAFVAYQFRFHPGLRWIKNLLEERRLGRLAAVHIVNGEYLPDWHPYEDYRQSHAARRALGGGALRIQTHEFDYALWLFGMPRRLYAVGGHLSGLELDVEDSVSVLLSCEDRGGVFPVHIHLDYLQRPPQRICEVIGDAGKVHYDFYSNQVVFHDVKSRTTQQIQFHGFERNQMFVDELRHFLACLRGETQPLVDLRESVRSLRFSLLADESLRAGTPVAFAPDLRTTLADNH
ncbi:MAG: Gfo/Idh/MocA family oxidoreductase [Thermomicrobiales bacterium]|nr:MAG: Gfo/Idh/MocA family oxidoreductase [Thermomicrobiales bacterium]